ncbi:hypothetical protein M1M34_gp003 [Haloarcula tailed virus 2]|uniref:Uncharacterized protein n=1 Tax=Haloarcula tailed virus 2 TaxID=2877989 RepID=A0AAE9BYQ9_9CAUD|nr:hypothetical protein M1M34_gp003 [Haloarcula tailed virus 2]UBF23154.1 hypothetical protein HATV-2_gp3 [Haloarcula tailed virus 2]
MTGGLKTERGGPAFTHPFIYQYSYYELCEEVENRGGWGQHSCETSSSRSHTISVFRTHNYAV